MKKAELVKVLLSYENIGELDKDGLEGMTIPNLKLLRKELDDELEKEGRTPDAEKKADAPVEFATMCGMPFDPNQKGGCYIQCSKEYPDSFKECSEHFAAQPVTKAKAKVKGAGMNQWYHRPGTQAGMIDGFFINGNVGTIEEICEAVDGRSPRVMNHMKHLVADWGVDILKGSRKNKETNKSEVIYFWKDKDKRRKGDPLPGKTAYPRGFPKNHPLNK